MHANKVMLTVLVILVSKGTDIGDYNQLYPAERLGCAEMPSAMIEAEVILPLLASPNTYSSRARHSEQVAGVPAKL